MHGRTEPFRRTGLTCLLLACLATTPALLPAQDTPDMLAALHAALPPVPDEVPLRETLPDAIRSELPDTRLDTHRWSKVPAERFVILRGRRIQEDGVAGNTLWVRHIRKDGVVFQFRNRFFLQPR